MQSLGFIKDLKGYLCHEFFLSGSNLSSRTPPRRLEISTQTLLNDIAKGWDYFIGGVSKVTGNRKCPKTNQTLTLKIIGCERKCHFFHFLLREIEI